MAKDDYSYIVFKILTYLYGCFKRKYSFDKDAFNKAVVRKEDIAEEYLIDILKNLSDEEMIKGLVFQKIWGGEYILISDLCDMKITAKGIRYLEDNSKMKQMKEHILESAGVITELVKLVFKSV